MEKRVPVIFIFYFHKDISRFFSSIPFFCVCACVCVCSWAVAIVTSSRYRGATPRKLTSTSTPHFLFSSFFVSFLGRQPRHKLSFGVCAIKEKSNHSTHLSRSMAKLSCQIDPGGKYQMALFLLDRKTNAALRHSTQHTHTVPNWLEYLKCWTTPPPRRLSRLEFRAEKISCWGSLRICVKREK